MKALYGKVTAVKAFVSTGSCRVEVEVPVEVYREAVALLWDQQVLVTLAPDLGRAYGMVVPREPLLEPGPPPPFIEEREQIGPLCMLAVKLCREPDFQVWLQHEFAGLVDEAESRTPEEWAKRVIMEACEIGSRRDLDESEPAAEAFHYLIRKPYHAYVEAAKRLIVEGKA